MEPCQTGADRYIPRLDAGNRKVEGRVCPRHRDPAGIARDGVNSSDLGGGDVVAVWNETLNYSSWSLGSGVLSGREQDRGNEEEEGEGFEEVVGRHCVVHRMLDRDA